MVCGIANPRPLKDLLMARFNSYDMLRYADHHIFNSDDLADIKSHFAKIQSGNKMILTTEKDAMRLFKFAEHLKDFPIYVLPIEHSFLFNQAPAFNKTAIDFIASFKK